jgi:hypothetical protein
VVKSFCLLIFGFWFCSVPWCLGGASPGSEYHGQVTFGGLPVPGATITATQGSKKLSTITDQLGLYSFPDLTDGKWSMEVEMTGFSIIKQDVVMGAKAPAAKWELKLLPLDQIKAQVKSSPGMHVVTAQTAGEKDRGRENRLNSIPPPSEPDRRVSRIRLSSWWFYLGED